MTKFYRISGKVNDMFDCWIYDENGKKIVEYDGYVPSDSGVGSGDTIELEIDIETGQILNWKNPLKSKNFVEEVGLIQGDDEDDRTFEWRTRGHF